jgi:hypothetical protein
MFKEDVDMNFKFLKQSIQSHFIYYTSKFNLVCIFWTLLLYNNGHSGTDFIMTEVMCFVFQYLLYNRSWTITFFYKILQNFFKSHK